MPRTTPPPPQCPPDKRAQRIIDQINALAAQQPAPEEWAVADQDGRDAIQVQWMDLIESLRNVAVDAAAAWERTLIDAKRYPTGETTTGVNSWNRLANWTAWSRASLQFRERDTPDQRLAAEPRVSKFASDATAEASDT